MIGVSESFWSWFVGIELNPLKTSEGFSGLEFVELEFGTQASPKRLASVSGSRSNNIWDMVNLDAAQLQDLSFNEP